VAQLSFSQAPVRKPFSDIPGASHVFCEDRAFAYSTGEVLAANLQRDYRIAENTSIWGKCQSIVGCFRSRKAGLQGARTRLPAAGG
jgi:hypothetical protein